MDIGVIENKYSSVHTEVQLILESKIPLCKISGEPQSYRIMLIYTPNRYLLEMRQPVKLIESLLDTPLDLETLVQIIAKETSSALNVAVEVRAEFVLSNGLELHVQTAAHIL